MSEVVIISQMSMIQKQYSRLMLNLKKLSFMYVMVNCIIIFKCVSASFFDTDKFLP